MLAERTYKRYKDVVNNGMERLDLCTGFDAGFLSDFAIKFDQYKRHTFVSEKQEEQFERIEAYLQQEMGSDYEHSA